VFFGAAQREAPYCVLSESDKATCRVPCDGIGPCPELTFEDVGRILALESQIALLRRDGTVCVVASGASTCGAARLFDFSGRDVALGAAPEARERVDLTTAIVDSSELILPEGVVCSLNRLKSHPDFPCHRYETWQPIRGYSKPFSLRTDGTVWGPRGMADVLEWSHGVPEQAKLPGFEAIREIAASEWLLCGLAPGGRVSCVERASRWAPFGEPGQKRLPHGAAPLTCAQQLASGDRHVCAQSCDDRTYCWGKNDMGQLAALPPERTSHRLELAGVRQLAAGGRKTCALLDGGKVVCWGDSSHLQLGAPLFGAIYAQPRAVPLSRPAQALACSESKTCALLDDGRVSCWGRNDRSDSPGEPEQLAPHLIEGVRNGTQVAVDDEGGCAVVGGEVACWGSNRTGLRGLGHDQPVASVASRVPSLDGVVDLDLGATFACAVLKDGRLRCWGAFVVSDQKAVVAPMDIASVGDALDVTAAGSYGYCVRTRSGSGLCASKAREPPALRWPADVTQIVNPIGSTEHGSCAVLGTGAVRCSGQLARGDIVSLVEGMKSPRSLTIGDGHACALDPSAHVICVGDDSVGQLGTGRLLFSTEPVLVP
jgi:hypothetical protein